MNWELLKCTPLTSVTGGSQALRPKCVGDTFIRLLRRYFFSFESNVENAGTRMLRAHSQGTAAHLLGTDETGVVPWYFSDALGLDFLLMSWTR